MVYKYNGIRNLILPEHPHLTVGVLADETDEESRLRNVMKAFLDKDVIVVFREPENQYRERIHDNYVNCSFARGRLSLLAPKIVLQNSSSVTKVNLNDLLDLIPIKNLDSVAEDGLKLFTFYSIDTNKPVDEYNIMSTDPVRAFVSRNDFKTNPLYLFRIQELYSGIQFNTMRNDG